MCDIEIKDVIMDSKFNNINVLSCTADIVSAHVSYNKIDVDDISSLIKEVFQTLDELHHEFDLDKIRLKPYVPISESIMPDYLVCLEDGKELKMLKRYLKTTHNLSPDEYRKKWGLPNDYPMVAPNYAKKRSQLAKDSGLGKD